MLRNMTEEEKRIVLDGIGNLVAYRGERDNAQEAIRQTYARAATRRRRRISRERASRTLSREQVMG